MQPTTAAQPHLAHEAGAPWGMIAAINLHGCDRGRLADPDTIRRFIPTVIDAIGMRAHGPLRLDRFGQDELAGWSAMQFIETSCITLHADESLGPLLRRHLLVPSLRAVPRGRDRGRPLRRHADHHHARAMSEISALQANGSPMSQIWSNTDFPYMCLKDEVRTLAFRDAIRAAVRPGDIVVDVGAGSGILSFFAAEAGAARVYAVEIDPVSAAALRRSIEMNPAVADRICVVEGDAAVVDLPRSADVVVAEIIETGLLDEQQVPVLNALRRSGVIGEDTRLVPCSYETTLQLVATDHRYYGFVIAAPKHEWPFYASGPGWHRDPGHAGERRRQRDERRLRRRPRRC